MNKSVSITIIKCVLVSAVVVLQALMNLTELSGAKMYLGIATGAIVLFETVLEKQIRLNFKAKKHANPPHVQVQYDDTLPETVPSAPPSMPRQQIDGRSLGFIHNLVKPQETGMDKSRSLPERYTEYSQYGLPDFEGQRGISNVPEFRSHKDINLSINPGTPVAGFF